MTNSRRPACGRWTSRLLGVDSLFLPLQLVTLTASNCSPEAGMRCKRSAVKRRTRISWPWPLSPSAALISSLLQGGSSGHSQMPRICSFCHQEVNFTGRELSWSLIAKHFGNGKPDTVWVLDAAVLQKVSDRVQSSVLIICNWDTEELAMGRRGHR